MPFNSLMNIERHNVSHVCFALRQSVPTTQSGHLDMCLTAILFIRFF